MEDAAIAGTQDKPPSAGMKVRLEHMNSGLCFHLKALLPTNLWATPYLSHTGDAIASGD
ncbi:hypothetical protein [Polaromonas sp.]|uniref:hypothetical protein n=1 Tax=Polaromonas sp. TaxID=1869339 RepID=UPI002FC842B4